MSDVNQTTRQLYLLKILHDTNSGLSIKELHEKIMYNFGDVTQRTIRRDIDKLSQEYCIKEIENSYAMKYSIEGFNLGEIILSVNDIYALSLIKSLLQNQNSNQSYHSSVKLIDRLIQTSIKNNPHLHNCFKTFLKVRLSSNYEMDKNLKEENILILSKSITERKKIKIIYRSFNSNNLSERIIEPYEILWQEGKLHVIAYCNLRKELRDFRVSRIIELSLTKEKYEFNRGMLEEFEKKRFINLVGSEIIILKVKFSREKARFVKEYEAIKADLLINNQDGTVTFVKKTAISKEIISWILSFGGDACVLEPQILINEVKKEIKKLTEIYL